MNIPTYTQVHTWDNLWEAWRKAARGKRGRPPAAAFEYRLADNLLALEEELRGKTYLPGPYSSFFIHEPKRRLISAAPFRDRVVHHALCRVIEPLFERSFIQDSYANRVGQGTHRALDRCQAFARRYRYALQCDVVQFFPAIDHALLRQTLARKLRDPDLLWLVDRILESGVGVLAGQYDMVYFAGDDPSTGSGQGLFAVNRPRGLPIGNLTSQFWANCYLNPFDHFVKRELRCPAYLRYVDDFVLFGDDRAQLWAWKAAIMERMARLRLTIHERRAHGPPALDDPRAARPGAAGGRGHPLFGFRGLPATAALEAAQGRGLWAALALAGRAVRRRPGDVGASQRLGGRLGQPRALWQHGRVEDKVAVGRALLRSPANPLNEFNGY
jgi:hypothetical protein